MPEIKDESLLPTWFQEALAQERAGFPNSKLPQTLGSPGYVARDIGQGWWAWDNGTGGVLISDGRMSTQYDPPELRWFNYADHHPDPNGDPDYSFADLRTACLLANSDYQNDLGRMAPNATVVEPPSLPELLLDGPPVEYVRGPIIADPTEIRAGQVVSVADPYTSQQWLEGLLEIGWSYTIDYSDADEAAEDFRFQNAFRTVFGLEELTVEDLERVKSRRKDDW